MAGKQLGIDNVTRWNSWYTLLMVAVEKKDQLNAFCIKHYKDLSSDILSGPDWEIIELTEQFLQPFHQATLSQQANWSSIEQVLLNMEILLKHYETSKQEFIENAHLTRCIEMGWLVLEGYYMKSDSSPAYAMALLLHPSRRLEYIRTIWKHEWWEAIEHSVRQLWVDYRDRLLPIDTVAKQANISDQIKVPSIYDSLRKSLDITSRKQEQGDEFERYIHATPHPLDGISALEWWEIHRLEFPRLSCLARDILSIPAMSDEPERIFSSSRRVLSWDRARLGDKVLEHLTCIKHWKRNGHISLFTPSDDT